MLPDLVALTCGLPEVLDNGRAPDVGKTNGRGSTGIAQANKPGQLKWLTSWRRICSGSTPAVVVMIHHITLRCQACYTSQYTKYRDISHFPRQFKSSVRLGFGTSACCLLWSMQAYS